MTHPVNNLKYYFLGDCSFSELSRSNKLILIALSAIMAVGMIFSYSLSAPWFITAGFFLLTLLPLLPIGKVFNTSVSKPHN